MITAFDSSYNKVSAVSSGLPQLDRLTGIGGIPFKRITEISGVWSVGKTSLALQIVASGQREGYEAVWYDAEWAWENDYAETLGVDTKKLQLIQTRKAEDALDEILYYIDDDKSKGWKAHKNCVIVIDAIGALHPTEEVEKYSGERTIGTQSALVARFCRKIVPLLALNNCALVVLNHEFTPIMANGGRPQLMTSGGKKLEYHKSMWIRLQKTGKHIKQGEDFVGYQVEAEIRKNKLAPTQKSKCTMDIFYGRGFNTTSDLLQDALDKGVIRKDGNTYFFGEEKLAVGLPKLRVALDNHELQEKIKEML